MFGGGGGGEDRFFYHALCHCFAVFRFASSACIIPPPPSLSCVRHVCLNWFHLSYHTNSLFHLIHVYGKCCGVRFVHVRYTFCFFFYLWGRDRYHRTAVSLCRMMNEENASFFFPVFWRFPGTKKPLVFVNKV